MKRTAVWMLMCAGMVSLASAATRNVFFAGGQSNAKSVWGSAIASGLQASYGSSLVMVWTNHPGEPLANWYTTSGKINYSNDLFNAAGTGLLQSQIQAIKNAGDEPVLKGFFWFQGESDTGSNTTGYATMDAYTNRFLSMLTQLKTDLTMTNDIRFTLAIIDANTNYLADLISIGRDMACVDYLRARQMEMSVLPRGSYVDTRGYTRPSDIWHLSTDELTRLGGNMAASFTNAFGASLPIGLPVEIPSDDADGSIFPTGTFPAQDLIVGTAATTPYNGVALFRLPTNRIDAANLILTVAQNYGPLPNANIDVWGLGYMKTAVISNSWVLNSDTDGRTLLNNMPVTKIADNLVTAGQPAAAGSVWQLNAAQKTNLAAFLTSLYQKGAVAGDYAVIRINPDALMTNATNIRFGGSHRTSPDQRAKLSVMLADALAPTATEQSFKVYSHEYDGGVTSNGISTSTDLISGTGGGGPQDWSGIAFFPLPQQTMISVSLALPVVEFSGVMPSANIDIWGLGYQTTPALNNAWFCTNDVDTRILLNNYPPVKLADNIVTAKQTSVDGAIWTNSAAQSLKLKNYLNGLYNKGAKPGDYVVIRINMDAPQGPLRCGVRWGGSQQTNINKRSTLSGVYAITTNHLVNADFELGTGTSAANWSVSYNNFLGQRSTETPRSGKYSFKVAVNGDQSTNKANNINVFQNVSNPKIAGRLVTMGCYARHNATDPLVTNTNQQKQRVELRIWWMTNGVQGASVTSTDTLLPTDPTNSYKYLSVAGIAPTNASGVQAMIIFRTGTDTDHSLTNGSAIIDDLSLRVFEPEYPKATLLWMK